MTVHVHHWLLEPDKHEAAGRCACGVERTFSGGVDFNASFEMAVARIAPRKHRPDSAARRAERARAAGKKGGAATKAKYTKETA
jgi:hypothetical protein